MEISIQRLYRNQVLLLCCALALLLSVGLTVTIGYMLSLGSAVLLHGTVIALGVSGVFCLLCWRMGKLLERRLLTPIQQISSIAQRITLYKDYSLRVDLAKLKHSPHEITLLTESFNAMLEEIEDRDRRLRRKGDEIEKARQQAVDAAQAKTRFLANVTHELRTPLNAVIGFSAILANQQFGPLGDPKYASYATDIQESGQHLLDVINDILDLSKAEAGALSITYGQVNLQKIVDKALRMVSGQALAHKVDIYTDIQPKMPKLYADRVRVMQILLNLLSNAIKFTEPGGKIILRVQAEAAKNDVYYLLIQVEDTGIGMSAEAIANAFVAFNQADAGLNREHEGTGLGLPLTKRLVELHHGKIEITSTLGEGTTVTVRLTSDPSLMP